MLGSGLVEINPQILSLLLIKWLKNSVNEKGEFKEGAKWESSLKRQLENPWEYLYGYVQ